MIILGIDPGMAILGYGVVEQIGNSLKVIDYGVVNTPSDMKTSQRLTVLFEAVGQLIERYRPEAAAVRTVFQQKCQNGTFHRARQGCGNTGSRTEGYRCI